MNTTTDLTADDVALGDKPGARLAAIREKHGHSMEYVAGKLHLRVRVIELLEADAYDEMPEPVFIKGYLRAYANLLDIDSVPLLEQFNGLYREEDKNAARTLWQSRKPTHRTEHWVRIGTALFAVSVLVAVFGWWIKNKEVEHLFSTHVKTAASETHVTDLSDMRALMSANPQTALLDLKDE